MPGNEMSVMAEVGEVKSRINLSDYLLAVCRLQAWNMVE
jgi:hypothetical protein